MNNKWAGSLALTIMLLSALGLSIIPVFAQVETNLTTPTVELLFSITGASHFNHPYAFVRGETAQFDARALAFIEDDQDISAEGLVFEVEITDPSNRVVLSRNFTTDTNGEFNFTFPITDDLEPGRYHLTYSTSEKVELMLHSKSFSIAAGESDFIDLSSGHSFDIAIPQTPIKFGESFMLQPRICPPINFANVSDDGFIEPVTGRDVTSGPQWIILVFELQSNDSDASPVFRPAYLKSNTCESTVEIAEDFFPSPGQWSMNVTARWLGKDGMLYQVRSNSSAKISVDSVFASGIIQPFTFSGPTNATLVPLDWSADGTQILARIEDHLAIINRNGDAHHAFQIANILNINSTEVTDSVKLKRALFSEDMSAIYFLSNGELYRHDHINSNTTHFSSLTHVNDFDVTSDGRIVYSTSDGFWIADANADNTRRFLNYPTDIYSSFDASADGSHIVFEKDNKWKVADTVTGNSIDVPLPSDVPGCGEKALLSPDGQMIVFKHQFCAYRGGAVWGSISIIALDGSYRERIVPVGNDIPQLHLVSDDGRSMMYSAGSERAESMGIDSSELGIYVMTLATVIPEFGTFTLITIAASVAGLIIWTRSTSRYSIHTATKS